MCRNSAEKKTDRAQEDLIWTRAKIISKKKLYFEPEEKVHEKVIELSMKWKKKLFRWREEKNKKESTPLIFIFFWAIIVAA